MKSMAETLCICRFVKEKQSPKGSVSHINDRFPLKYRVTVAFQVTLENDRSFALFFYPKVNHFC